MNWFKKAQYNVSSWGKAWRKLRKELGREPTNYEVQIELRKQLFKHKKYRWKNPELEPIYSQNKWKDHLPGGKADRKTPNDYEKNQIQKGQDVEFEHTNDPDIAKEIAMDHLEEHDDYYAGLKHMEDLLSEIERKQKSKKQAGRGRYPGQLAGDENRTDNALLDETISDNEIAEGEHVRILNRMARDKNWHAFNQYVQKLKQEGHSQQRINSIMTRAMHKLRL